MVSAADLEGWRDALLKARFAGEKVVSYGDTRIEYKSDAEMAHALADLERRLAGLSRRPVREIRIAASKGV